MRSVPKSKSEDLAGGTENCRDLTLQGDALHPRVRRALGMVLTPDLGCHPMRFLSLDASKPSYRHFRSGHC